MFGRDSETVYTAFGCVAYAGESSGIALILSCGLRASYERGLQVKPVPVQRLLCCFFHTEPRPLPGLRSLIPPTSYSGFISSTSQSAEWAEARACARVFPARRKTWRRPIGMKR